MLTATSILSFFITGVLGEERAVGVFRALRFSMSEALYNVSPSSSFITYSIHWMAAYVYKLRLEIMFNHLHQMMFKLGKFHIIHRS
jgi:hypothetical protein